MSWNGRSCVFIIIFVLTIVHLAGCGFYRRIIAVSGEETVYMTGTDRTHYHRANCFHVGRAHQAFFLSDAVQLGYKPCPICHPPVLKKGQHSRN